MAVEKARYLESGAMQKQGGKPVGSGEQNASADPRAEDEAEAREEGGNPVRCPFCGDGVDSCAHYFGERDTIFSRPFTIESGPLASLAEEFAQLEEMLRPIAESHLQPEQLTGIRPARLRRLAAAVSEGSIGAGFSSYLEDAGNDIRGDVRSAFIDSPGGPGMSSDIHMFWARDPNEALSRIRDRIRRDVRSLERLSIPEPSQQKESS